MEVFTWLFCKYKDELFYLRNHPSNNNCTFILLTLNFRKPAEEILWTLKERRVITLIILTIRNTSTNKCKMEFRLYRKCHGNFNTLVSKVLTYNK